MSQDGSMPDPRASNEPSREAAISADVVRIIDEATGIPIESSESAVPFVELGFDSLSLTQLAIQVRQRYQVELTFRQLMESHRSLDSLVAYLTKQVPATSIEPKPAGGGAEEVARAPTPMPEVSNGAVAPQMLEQVIRQQMEMMSQQLQLLCRAHGDPGFGQPAPKSQNGRGDPGSEPRREPEAFGAIARIDTKPEPEAGGGSISAAQRLRLEAFIRRYAERTQQSKAYTQAHRAHLADPRVVNGFAPLTKEITYQIVVERSEGSRLWDLDGNEYIDALNGFGMSLFGWQPDFIVDAIKRRIDEGYEIGPQHALTGEVAAMICEFTGFDRAGFCNTGSEAVMGAMRVARTVTGRSTIVIFSGAYHGIFDEVVVRATGKQRAFPAAPGIMPSAAKNVLVLEYGTPESLAIIKSRAHELAAVLVEPVQSRRPDFQPRDFLQELREVTQESGTVLIFDEVVTGFRSHPAGIQGLFGIQADICTYGKVIGGGFPIGVIAGKSEFMDALDGGAWQYGDDSIPAAGVTYFAGTFVRHPLALAATKAALEHLRARGPALQVALTSQTDEMVAALNEFCREVGAPISVVSFASMWRINFTQEHPLQGLLFAMLRLRGVHIIDNFPCFLTTAHTAQDVAQIISAFQESVTELQAGGFLPRPKSGAGVVLDDANPPVPGARIGKDEDGNAAWFIPNPEVPGKYLRLD